MARKKRMTDTVKRLRAAYQQGKGKGLWSNTDQCAQKIDMTPSSLLMQCNGFIKDDSLVAASLEKIERLLGEKVTLSQPEEQAPQTTTSEPSADSELHAELKRLYEQGKEQQRWSSVNSCAQAIKIPRRTLTRYLSESCSEGKRTKSYQTIIKKMRRKLEETEGAPSAPSTPQPAAATSANAQHGAVLLIGVLQQIAALATQKTLQTMEGLLPSLLAEAVRGLGEAAPSTDDLAHKLQQALQFVLPTSQAAPSTDVIAGALFDRVLAGVADLRDQNLNGVRFVINSRNFRKLHGTVTREEVEDTGLLLDEVTRRFAIFAQLDDVNLRALIAQKLAERLDRMYRTIEQSKDVCPTEAADEIGMDRKTQNLLNP